MSKKLFEMNLDELDESFIEGTRHYPENEFEEYLKSIEKNNSERPPVDEKFRYDRYDVLNALNGSDSSNGHHQDRDLRIARDFFLKYLLENTIDMGKVAVFIQNTNYMDKKNE